MSSINNFSKLPITLYKHSDYNNFKEWKSTIDAILSNHPDKLLPVVQQGKLAFTTKLKLQTQLKAMGEKLDESTENDFIKESNITAWHIIYPTIDNQTFKNTIDRKYGENHDAHELYKYIISENKVTDDTSDERLVEKDAERNRVITAGAKSGTAAHITEFVEELLRLNAELQDTPFYWTDPLMVTYVLDKIAVHNSAFVSGFKGSRVGVDGWKNNFDAVWKQLKAGLESDTATKEAANHHQSDVLHTNTQTDDLIAELRALRAEVTELKSTNLAATTQKGKRGPLPNCPDCNHPHLIHRVHGCIGKAVSTGKITMAQAKAVFPNNDDPERTVNVAKGRYEAYATNKASTNPSGSGRPTKVYSLNTPVHTIPCTDQTADIALGPTLGHLATQAVSDPDQIGHMNSEPQRVTREATGIQASPGLESTLDPHRCRAIAPEGEGKSSEAECQFAPDPVPPHKGPLKVIKPGLHSGVELRPQGTPPICAQEPRSGPAVISGGPKPKGMHPPETGDRRPHNQVVPRPPQDDRHPMQPVDTMPDDNMSNTRSGRTPPQGNIDECNLTQSVVLPQGAHGDWSRGGVLKFDTQAEDTILNDERFFPDGIDKTVRLHIIGINPTDPGAPSTVTEGQGTAHFRLADGNVIVIKGAHLYPRSTSNVVATRKTTAAVVDLDNDGLRIKATGDLLLFDAGYCAMRVFPSVGYDVNWPMDPTVETRHPIARAAILEFGTTAMTPFGGVTGGQKSTAGVRDMGVAQLGRLYANRTGLGPRRLKALPDATDAPKALRRLPELPYNDHARLRANMPKVPTKPSEGSRDKVVCFDLQGPFTASKHGNNRYVCNFHVVREVEGATVRANNLYFMPTKDRFPDMLEEFLDSGDYSTYQLYTDNEVVLNSKRVRGILRRRHMLRMRNSCEYEPWQNPAERQWRTLTAGSREFALRGFGDTTGRDDIDPERYWPYTHQHQADVENAVNDPTARTRISHLRVPFCLAYARTPAPYRTSKVAPQAEACMHLGYSRSKPGYVLEVLEGPRKGKVITSSQVKFRENVFPMRHPVGATPSDLLWGDIPEVVAGTFDIDIPSTQSTDDDDDGLLGLPAPDVPPDSADGGDFDDDDGDDAGPDGDAGLDHTASDNAVDHDQGGAVNEDDGDSSGGGASDGIAGRTRSRAPLGDWRDIFTTYDRARRDGTIRVLAATGRLPESDPKFVPGSFKRILRIQNEVLRDEWLHGAYYKELDGLFDRPDVLRAIPMPPGTKESELMRLLSILTIKSDGRKKCRTVLGAGKESLDRLELGYERTFSPTCRPSTLRLLCSLAPDLVLIIRGGDTTQAYAQADWPAGVKKVKTYMPDGYATHDEEGRRLICEVGNLYGHPIAGRNWYDKLRKEHIGQGYVQSKHDPCLFMKERDGQRLYILLYVDDVITFCPRSSNLYGEWESWFTKTFTWTNYGTDLHEFLSIRIRQVGDTVTLDMERYIDDLREEHFPGGIHHPYTVPADTDLAGVVHKASLERDTTYQGTEVARRYRRLLMQLNYAATHTRPDIGISVNLLMRVQAWPSPDLLQRAERILIYTIGSKDLALTYRKSDEVTAEMHWAPRVTVKGSSDADFAIAHSTSGWAFSRPGGGALDWGVKKQDNIALYTQEAEIVAGSHAACAGVGLRGLLEECGFPQKEPTVLYLDNSSAIDLAHDPMHHNKGRHIARRDLFIRELVERGEIKPTYVKTDDNVADALTKPLPKSKFIQHRNKLLGIGF